MYRMHFLCIVQCTVMNSVNFLFIVKCLLDLYCTVYNYVQDEHSLFVQCTVMYKLHSFILYSVQLYTGCNSFILYSVLLCTGYTPLYCIVYSYVQGTLPLYCTVYSYVQCKLTLYCKVYTSFILYCVQLCIG